MNLEVCAMRMLSGKVTRVLHGQREVKHSGKSKKYRVFKLDGIPPGRGTWILANPRFHVKEGDLVAVGGIRVSCRGRSIDEQTLEKVDHYLEITHFYNRTTDVRDVPTNSQLWRGWRSLRLVVLFVLVAGLGNFAFGNVAEGVLVFCGLIPFVGLQWLSTSVALRRRAEFLKQTEAWIGEDS